VKECDTNHNFILSVCLPIMLDTLLLRPSLYCNTAVLCQINAQLFHKLSHSYIFRHYYGILREFVINTLRSYVSIPNTTVGNAIYSLKLIHIGFVLLKSQCLKSFNVRIILFILKWAKIVLFFIMMSLSAVNVYTVCMLMLPSCWSDMHLLDCLFKIILITINSSPSILVACVGSAAFRLLAKGVRVPLGE